MPRVLEKTKSSRGKPFPCVRCSSPIKPGQDYYEWSFFRSAPKRQHSHHGPPRPSQTTASKLSSVYGAIEDAEDNIPKAEDVSDIASALQSVADEARQIADEYQEAVDAMGAAGESGTSAERVDTLNDFADTLEDAVSEIEGAEFEKDADSEDDEEEQKKEWLEELRQKATDALGELSI